MNLEDVKKRVSDEALKLGFDIRDVRTKVRVDWFPLRTAHEVFLIASVEETIQGRASVLERLGANMMPTVIKAGKEFPLNTSMLVLSIFSSEDGWNVYALPTTGAEAKPTRYTLSRTAGVMDVEQMNFTTFIAEIVNEYSLLDADATARTREKAHILEYLQALPPETSLRDAIDDIEEDKHLPSDEDDEEEPEAAVAAPVTPAPEAATSTSA